MVRPRSATPLSAGSNPAVTSNARDTARCPFCVGAADRQLNWHNSPQGELRVLNSASPSQPLDTSALLCYTKPRKAVNIVPQLRKLRQQVQKQHNLKIKRQKTVFSTCFVLTMIVSLIMLVICAINKGPTLITTLISGCAWLIFDLLFALSIKNKWALLFDECSTGRVSFDYHKTDMQRRKDNWQGNCFKFAISIAVLAIHVIFLFYLLK